MIQPETFIQIIVDKWRAMASNIVVKIDSYDGLLPNGGF